MVCVMMRRSEMLVLSVKFWRCSPISVHAQGLARLGSGSSIHARVRMHEVTWAVLRCMPRTIFRATNRRRSSATPAATQTWATRRSCSAPSTRGVSNPPGQANHPVTSPPSTDGTRFIPGPAPRARRPSRPPTPAATRRRRTALAAGTGCRTAPRFTHTAWRRPQTRGRRPVGMDARRLPPRPGACASSKHSPCGSSSRPLSASRRTFELNSHRFGSATAVE